MTALSEYLQSRVQKAIFHGQALTLPTNISIGLTSSPATDSQTGATIPEIASTVTISGVQVSTGYARINVCTPVANGNQSWLYQTSGTMSNINQLVFPTCREDWGPVSGIVVLDSSMYGSGNLLFHGTLDKPRVVLEGDAPKFDAGVLQVCLD